MGVQGSHRWKGDKRAAGHMMADPLALTMLRANCPEKGSCGQKPILVIIANNFRFHPFTQDQQHRWTCIASSFSCKSSGVTKRKGVTKKYNENIFYN